MRQKDCHEFEASLGYIVSVHPGLNKMLPKGEEREEEGRGEAI